jgi:hypothetical protein
MSSQEDSPKKRKRISFTPEEDDRLRELVLNYGGADWRRIASKMPKRNARQCRERWFHYLTPEVSNGPWTPQEEELLRTKVHESGHRWTAIQQFFPGRTDINIKNHWKQMKKVPTVAQDQSDTIEHRKPFDLFMAQILGCRPFWS